MEKLRDALPFIPEYERPGNVISGKGSPLDPNASLPSRFKENRLVKTEGMIEHLSTAGSVTLPEAADGTKFLPADLKQAIRAHLRMKGKIVGWRIGQMRLIFQVASLLRPFSEKLRTIWQKKDNVKAIAGNAT